MLFDSCKDILIIFVAAAVSCGLCPSLPQTDFNAQPKVVSLFGHFSAKLRSSRRHLKFLMSCAILSG